ncbi:hypothetical protein ASZ90_018059 [hydrocarbon metagenome]|uniref:Uncharacterized protein n=1 Tax=hydrocarbon metagenome TaxID=938273 RepID=A0A0W8E7G1_9ZZZZ
MLPLRRRNYSNKYGQEKIATIGKSYINPTFLSNIIHV